MIPPETGVCVGCGSGCSDDDYCFGCKQFICPACCVTSPWGSHTAGAHLRADNEDEDD